MIPTAIKSITETPINFADVRNALYLNIVNSSPQYDQKTPGSSRGACCMNDMGCGRVCTLALHDNSLPRVIMNTDLLRYVVA